MRPTSKRVLFGHYPESEIARDSSRCRCACVLSFVAWGCFLTECPRFFAVVLGWLVGWLVALAKTFLSSESWSACSGCAPVSCLDASVSCCRCRWVASKSVSALAECSNASSSSSRPPWSLSSSLSRCSRCEAFALIMSLAKLLVSADRSTTLASTPRP